MFKLIVLQEFHPPPLSHVQFLLIKQILKTLVIVEYPKLGTVEIVPLDLQGKHYGCQLHVMSRVVSLMHLKLPRSIRHHLLLLHQHTTKP